MKKLHYFQHVPFENLGLIEDWANANGFVVSSTRFYQDATIPIPEDADWLVVMGGPMGVDDHDVHPWLADEKRAIGQAIEAGKVVLGICLGAQLIAEVLGAAVRKNAFKEIGWFPVYLERKSLDHPLVEIFPSQWNAFHWHGDTFDIPDGARLLASSSACRNQGFVYGDRIVALQFHMEVTRTGAAALVEHCGDEMKTDEYVATPEQILAPDAPFEASHRMMTQLLDYMNTL
jgi:GMP synthase-like glutamine amidotransferase